VGDHAGVGIRLVQLWGLVFGEAAAVAVLSLCIGTFTGAVMAYMVVKILAVSEAGWMFAMLVTLVMGGMLLSVAIAARNLRRLNPVELLREE
jgi:ABC-type antimicrobial peptide transport system permease subunit